MGTFWINHRVDIRTLVEGRLGIRGIRFVKACVFKEGEIESTERLYVTV